MRAIEATQVFSPRPKDECTRMTERRVRALFMMAAVVAVSLLAATQAVAGQSSTGELAFHPCTKCHPVSVDSSGQPVGQLPNGFEKHEIELEIHDILGSGEQACLACHASPQADPGKLILPDGSLVDITGDVSRVCQRCHFQKYREWEAGIHGRGEAKCSAAGCHDPHTPSWIYIAALPPFQGTGIEVRAVSEREPFKPMASPPVPPAVYTPMWLTIVASLGTVASVGLIGYLVAGRFKR